MVKKWHANQTIAVILFIFSIVYVMIAFQIPEFALPRPIDSDLFPKILGASMLILSILLFFERPMIESEADEDGAVENEREEVVLFWQQPKIQIIVTIVSLFIYIALFEIVGFVLMTFCLLVFLTFYYGYRRHLVNGIVALIVSVGFYLSLTKALGVYLPTGWLPF